MSKLLIYGNILGFVLPHNRDDRLMFENVVEAELGLDPTRWSNYLDSKYPGWYAILKTFFFFVHGVYPPHMNQQAGIAFDG